MAVLTVGGGALVGFAATALGAAAVLGTLAVGVIAPIALIGAAIAAVGAGVVAFAVHNEQAAQKQRELAGASNQVLESLRRQREEIKSVTDKALALVDAYGRLKLAKEALANAKTPNDRAEARSLKAGIEREIEQTEGIDDNKLKASDARKKQQDALEKLQKDSAFKGMNEEEKLAKLVPAAGARKA